jgi:predicted phosphodiesterase
MNYIHPIPFKGRDFVAVISTDKHFPAEYKPAAKALQQLIKDEKPTHLIDLGDVIDNKEISRFSQDTAIKEFIDNGGRTMPQVWRECIDRHNEIEKYAPKAERHILWGNHDIRVMTALAPMIHLYGETFNPLIEAWQRSRYKIKHYTNYPNNDQTMQSLVGARTEIPIVFSHRGRGGGLNHAKSTWAGDYKLGCSRIYGHTHDPQFFCGVWNVNRQSRDHRFAWALGAIADRSNERYFGFCDHRARTQWEPTALVIRGRKNLMTFEEVRLPVAPLVVNEGLTLG